MQNGGSARGYQELSSRRGCVAVRGYGPRAASLGYDARGKRITKRASGKTKTEAKDKLRELLRDLDDGLPVASDNYTVSDAVSYWLTYGLSKKAASTAANYECMANKHIMPSLGTRKLRQLTAEDVDRWLALKAKTLSTRSLMLIHSILGRSIRHAQARDRVKRNVAALCDIPNGQPGRPSKALTFAQVQAILQAAEKARLHAYIVLSLLTGARTEQLRALRWSAVDLEGLPDADPPVPPSIAVWRADRVGGDTKTPKSRRTLGLPQLCVDALRRHRERQQAIRGATVPSGDDLVFATRAGKPLRAGNVRRDFRKVADKAGLSGNEWTPREMRHSFVSVLSDNDVPIEHISRLVGHRGGSAVTERVYRLQIRPVITKGAEAMDAIFGPPSPPDRRSERPRWGALTSEAGTLEPSHGFDPSQPDQASDAWDAWDASPAPASEPPAPPDC